MQARNEQLPPEDLLARLQRHKGEILRQEERAKLEMKSFFRDLKDCLQSTETEILKKIDQQILHFHETAASTIKIIGKLKSNASEDSIGNAMEMINCRVMHGTKVDGQKLKELLREVYYFKIGAFHEDSRMELPELAESQSSMAEKMYSESAVEKIQSERDYYLRREEELQNKIRELEVNRKGTNIRELSKSALEEKCSRWAIERLREEKKVLIQRIGEASQQIMKQDALLSEHQEEIKRLGGIVSEVHGRSSIVGNSSIKSASVIVENEINHQRELELEAKNTQLSLELTSYMQRLQEVYEANKQLELELETIRENYSQLQSQYSQLKQESSMINQDYESNLRKKAAVEQQYAQLKKSYDQLNSKAQDERQTLKNLVEGLELGEKEIKQRLKHMESEKRAQLSAMEQKLITSQLQREKLLKRLDQVSTKTGEETNYKQLLNDEIARLLKQNSELQREIHVKQQIAFQAKEMSSKLQLELKETIKKMELSKKQCTQIKKANKELEKLTNDLKNRVASIDSLEYKLMSLEQHFIILQSEFFKCKEAYEKKSSQQERVMNIMKERFGLQLTQLLAEDIKKLKKDKPSKIEMIEKYIEEMIAFSSKTAQIKQLKEQLRDLKDKEGKEIKKKQRSSLQQSVSTLEWGLWTTNSKIFEERLKNEKDLFEQKLNEMTELLKKEQIIRNGLSEDLEKERATVSELKSKQKIDKSNEETAKNNKQLEEKTERMDEQLKRLRAKVKRLQAQLSDSQSELKTKRELSIGLRNQNKSKEDIITQLYKEIDIFKNQIDKHQRNTREMGNKEELLRQFKQSYKKIETQKQELTQSLEELSEKNKQLIRQLSKKDEVIKELSYVQEKETKKKEDGIIKSLNNEINELKEINRKYKNQVDRKDELIKGNKIKLEAKSREKDDLTTKTVKEYEKVFKEKQTLERKFETASTNLKKQQLKASNFAWTIKKIFEMCCKSIVKPQKQLSKGKPLTTQYYTNSSISPHTFKMGTPASNFKSFISCEGLDILNLKPQDIESCLGVQATTINKTDIGESWCMASPILNKRKEQERKEVMMQGLQQLERLLNAKEMSSNLLLQQFKLILQK